MSLVPLLSVQYHTYLRHPLRSGYKATLAQFKTIVSSLILSVGALDWIYLDLLTVTKLLIFFLFTLFPPMVLFISVFVLVYITNYISMHPYS